ncbi:sigma factor-like helix-turn-helix DNA-binding protein [Chryseobacterium luteum]|uniref:sigma factor-like helix-turn-helix DNA-binding protein n=1 Tax=Chryseobacterium luteum TaxID=421531 RepID=UPI001E397AC7|nr:sigma factor-like helix-turn-helix DNA-binding protein [Chryseobacterium luteum]
MEFYNQQRLVLILSRQLNMSNKDIAYEMGLSIKGVEAPITKALKHLSKELKYAGMLLMILLDKM